MTKVFDRNYSELASISVYVRFIYNKLSSECLTRDVHEQVT